MRGAATGLILLTAACAAPPVEHPPLPVPLPGRWTAAETPAGAVRGAWWTSFDDPGLTEAVRETLEKNQNLTVASARLQQAEALARIAGAPLLPQAQTAANAARRKQNFVGLPIPNDGDVLTSRSTAYGVSLDLSWEVDLWGRLRAGHAAALADMEAAGAHYEGASLSLAGQAAKAWFAAVEARGLVRLAESALESHRALAGRVRDRYERGLRSALDLRLALADQSSAEATLRARQVRLDGTLRQSEILRGRYPAARIAVRDELPGVPPAVPAGLPAELLSRRPDLRAAERRLRAAEARVAEARGALYPRIALTASGGTSSSALKDLVDGDFSVWNLAAGLLQPLFQGGRLRAGVDLAEARVREETAVYVVQALRAFAEVEAALAAEERLARQEEALRASVAESTSAVTLSEERYASGLEDIITVLEARRALLDAQAALLELRRLRLETRVDLHLALGGGFEAGE